MLKDHIRMWKRFSWREENWRNRRKTTQGWELTTWNSTSFPGSLIFPPPGAREERGKTRDPGNEAVLVPGQRFEPWPKQSSTCYNYFLGPKGVSLWKAWPYKECPCWDLHQQRNGCLYCCAYLLMILTQNILRNVQCSWQQLGSLCRLVLWQEVGTPPLQTHAQERLTEIMCI